jgi:hypothetical protein
MSVSSSESLPSACGGYDASQHLLYANIGVVHKHFGALQQHLFRIRPARGGRNGSVVDAFVLLETTVTPRDETGDPLAGE